MPSSHISLDCPATHLNTGDDEVGIEAADDERHEDAEPASSKDIAPPPHARLRVGEVHQRHAHEEQREGDDDLRETEWQQVELAGGVVYGSLQLWQPQSVSDKNKEVNSQTRFPELQAPASMLATATQGGARSLQCARLRQDQQLAGAPVAGDSSDHGCRHHRHQACQHAPLPWRQADAQEALHHDLQKE